MTAANQKNVVVWGDSIAANNNQPNAWPTICQQLLQVVAYPGVPIAIHNEGVCGKPASQAVTEFSTRIQPHAPDLVIIQFGFNDLRYDNVHAGQPLSTLEAFEAHLTTMTRQCREETHAKVILVANHRPRRYITMPNGMTYGQTLLAYNNVTQCVAEAEGTCFCNIIESLSPHYDWKELVCNDGVHLSPIGNTAYADYMGGLIIQQLATS